MATKTNVSTEPKPKRTRVLSPEMQALRDKFKAEVAAMNRAKLSAKILANITGKLLPKLSGADRLTLKAAIESNT